MSKAYFIPLSKDNSFSVIHGKRSYSKAGWSLKSIINFFELLHSPFISARIFQNRYFQSRLIILKELKKVDFNLSDIKISISHNKNYFIALVSKKDMKIAVDHEHNDRHISSALVNKIAKINKPNSLSSLGFINLLETLVKITNNKWYSLMEDAQVREIFGLKDTYITNLDKETIYSRFYSYNDNYICISADKLEMLK